MPVSRRQFLAGSAAAGMSLFLYQYVGGVKTVLAAIPGGTLDPVAGIPKFVTPMLIPPVMPRAGTKKMKGGKNGDLYEISVRQFQQQILPAPLGKTTVWGYGAVKGSGTNPLLIHNAPSLTIEAQAGRPVEVKWINELVDANGNYLPHLLPVDPTLHWANPPGGMAGRDTRPDFTGQPRLAPTPARSRWSPTSTAPWASATRAMGTPKPGTCRTGANLPTDYADRGTWYDFFAAKAKKGYGATWGPGYAMFRYPNLNRASTIWYHDHTLGMTRLNVYAGPAGFYLIRGGPDGDKAVLDSRTGMPAVLPGPAPKEGDRFPSKKTYYEIPIAIQDRSFNADGSLFYPDTREFFDGATALVPGFIPDSDLSPIWNPEFFGNTIMVNGNTWPFHTVEKRRYRFRFLNGCQSRFLILDFAGIPGVEVWQIGNEGGFLGAPVNLTATNGNRLLMGLAERADLIVDFTNVPIGSYVLGNVGPDEPFGGGIPDTDFDVADAASTGQVMQFRVVAALAADPTTPPRFLTLPAITPLPAAGTTRPLALMEMMSDFHDGAGGGDAGCRRHGTAFPCTRCGPTPSPRTLPSETPKSGSSSTSPRMRIPCTSTR